MPPDSPPPKKPVAARPDTTRAIQSALDDAASTLDAFRRDPAQLARIDRFCEMGRDVLERGGQLLACGNGGSMSQAMHFAEEWTGRFRADRRALRALALSDPAQITCIANDFGFEEIFARQVEALGQPGDLLVLLSTSGASPNILRAAQRAREGGLRTVALLGHDGGKAALEVDLPIIVPTADDRPATADRIQEVHLQILHAMIEGVERVLFPENYA